MKLVRRIRLGSTNQTHSLSALRHSVSVEMLTMAWKAIKKILKSNFHLQHAKKQGLSLGKGICRAFLTFKARGSDRTDASVCSKCNS